MAKLISEARDEIDHLYSIVREARYTVLFCNDNGIAVEHRGDQTQANEFKRWGIWLGGMWSEEAEGTNGIGTCIVERRAVNVHLSQHFRTRHIGLSCSGAPIFNSDGQLAAVLDVSSFDPEISEQSHALTGTLTQALARAIEERWFRDRFRRDWIVAVAPPQDNGLAMLLAVDQDYRIVGADLRARSKLLGNNNRIHDGISLWSIFEPALLPFVIRKDREDIAATLVPIGTSEAWFSLVTPPEAASAGWQAPNMARFHCRPRLHLIRDIGHPDPSPAMRGGLAPGTLRRVKEYIDANLGENIDLATLASAAELSIFHFARAFKQSTGETPHIYIRERRLERAHTLLATTDLSHSEIALGTGFSDQSHLARVFRQRFGMSPSMFKWSKR